MIHVGDVIKRKINLFDPAFGNKSRETTVEAVVVYIHPERRFYTLEYRLPGGTYRESEFFT